MVAKTRRNNSALRSLLSLYFKAFFPQCGVGGQLSNTHEYKRLITGGRRSNAHNRTVRSNVREYKRLIE
jgi:hypothetical protein